VSRCRDWTVGGQRARYFRHVAKWILCRDENGLVQSGMVRSLDRGGLPSLQCRKLGRPLCTEQPSRPSGAQPGWSTGEHASVAPVDHACRRPPRKAACSSLVARQVEVRCSTRRAVHATDCHEQWHAVRVALTCLLGGMIQGRRCAVSRRTADARYE